MVVSTCVLTPFIHKPYRRIDQEGRRGLVEAQVLPTLCRLSGDTHKVQTPGFAKRVFVVVCGADWRLVSSCLPIRPSIPCISLHQRPHHQVAEPAISALTNICADELPQVGNCVVVGRQKTRGRVGDGYESRVGR